MPKTIVSTGRKLDFLRLFHQFIKASETGKRLQKNGSRIKQSSIGNYTNVYKLLQKFCIAEEFELKIVTTTALKKRSFKTEQAYWKNFYTRFSSYLFANGAHDNYVGSVFKTIRTFFNYLEAEKNISISGLHKSFFVTKRDPPIFTLDANQLRFLIFDEPFHNKLDVMQKRVKDIFVFGCTVALRFSDLINLKQSNLIQINEYWYIRTNSIKTGTFTQVKLPAYAVDIIAAYKDRRSVKLFPAIYLNTFNNHLKEIGELAGWTYTVNKQQYRKGQLSNTASQTHRFCDLMSSHMMRKTAITNMLIHQVDESIVRKISGHAAGSKEFYRYVSYSQTLIDEKTDSYFENMAVRV